MICGKGLRWNTHTWQTESLRFSSQPVQLRLSGGKQCEKNRRLRNSTESLPVNAVGLTPEYTYCVKSQLETFLLPLPVLYENRPIINRNWVFTAFHTPDFALKQTHKFYQDSPAADTGI